jgi:hypothetical protein
MVTQQELEYISTLFGRKREITIVDLQRSHYDFLATYCCFTNGVKFKKGLVFGGKDQKQSANGPHLRVKHAKTG